MKSLILLVAIIGVTAGCTSYPMTHSYVKDYRIGQTKSAYIGQNMVSVKDIYYPSYYATKTITLPYDFTVSGTGPAFLDKYNWEVKATKGQVFETNGKAIVDGTPYDILYLPDTNGHFAYGLLVDAGGTMLKDTIYYRKAIKLQDMRVVPEDIKLQVSQSDMAGVACDRVNRYWMTCGTVNYELLYGGINNVGLNIMYREYTRDDLAKPSFYQNLVYETNASEIRFKDSKISIIKADNEKIIFNVVSDDLHEGEFLNGADPVFERIKLVR